MRGAKLSCRRRVHEWNLTGHHAFLCAGGTCLSSPLLWDPIATLSALAAMGDTEGVRDPQVRRRKRGMLKLFYGTQESPQATGNPLDIDSTGAKP